MIWRKCLKSRAAEISKSVSLRLGCKGIVASHRLPRIELDSRTVTHYRGLGLSKYA